MLAGSGVGWMVIVLVRLIASSSEKKVLEPAARPPKKFTVPVLPEMLVKKPSGPP